MKYNASWILLCLSLVVLVSPKLHEFGVINGTLITGERELAPKNRVIVLDTTKDSVIRTTYAIYSYNDDANKIVVTGSVLPPETFIRCSVGCHSNLERLTEFCYRVNPPACIHMASKNPIVFNVTSSAWYRVETSDSGTESMYTTYSIVY